jgi:CheY-like chemotaxis protein
VNPAGPEDTWELPIEAARILLVEDNPLNQEVVHGMLEILGGRADIAASGRQAIDLFKENSYDLVLMDCQMPTMDGYEATRRIRELENLHSSGAQTLTGGDRRKRVPIVAMTASALAGDRERCIESGMDDYLGKPFTMEQMQGFLEKWLLAPEEEFEKIESRTRLQGPSGLGDHGSGGAAGSAGEGAAEEWDGEPLDQRSLDEIRRLEESGVTGLFDRILSIYLESSPELVDALTEAVAKEDSEQLHSAAHSLKSTSASLGAKYLASLCRDLELKGRNGEVETAAPVLDELTAEFKKVTVALGKELRREAV